MRAFIPNTIRTHGNQGKGMDKKTVFPPHFRVSTKDMDSWLKSLEELRERFLEYREGWLTEAAFKLAIERYSQTLRAMRAAHAKSGVEVISDVQVETWSRHTTA